MIPAQAATIFDEVKLKLLPNTTLQETVYSKEFDKYKQKLLAIPSEKEYEFFRYHIEIKKRKNNHQPLREASCSSLKNFPLKFQSPLLKLLGLIPISRDNRRMKIEEP